LIRPCRRPSQQDWQEKSVTKKQSKIIIRSSNGDEEKEIVIDTFDRNPEAVAELIENGNLPESVLDMLRKTED
jgi:hypothetical protein